jgi:hypothetical protein
MIIVSFGACYIYSPKGSTVCYTTVCNLFLDPHYLRYICNGINGRAAVNSFCVLTSMRVQNYRKLKKYRPLVKSYSFKMNLN